MNTLYWLLAGWLTCSVPLACLVGRFISAAPPAAGWRKEGEDVEP